MYRKTTRFYFIILSLFALISQPTLAVKPDMQPSHSPMSLEHGDWTFSGLVSDEYGERFAYFFQVKRDGTVFDSVAMLFNAQTKELMFKQHNQAEIRQPKPFHWYIGRAFLQFNPINDVWSFGVKTEDKNGFNFKADMLKQSSQMTQKLRRGLSFVVEQTGQLNGYIHAKSEKQSYFVTAKNTWFRRLWLTDDKAQAYEVMGILCRFEDDSGFYSMNTLAPDAVQGALAGWLDAQGKPETVSQFVRARRSKDTWDIHILSPKTDLTLANGSRCEGVLAGFVTNKSLSGFCTLQNNLLQQEAPTEVAVKDQ